MKIFLVEREDDDVGYDESFGFAVTAGGYDDALAVCNEHGWGGAPAQARDQVTVTVIGTTTRRRGVELRSFNAG